MTKFTFSIRGGWTSKTTKYWKNAFFVLGQFTIFDTISQTFCTSKVIFDYHKKRESQNIFLKIEFFTFIFIGNTIFRETFPESIYWDYTFFLWQKVCTRFVQGCRHMARGTAKLVEKKKSLSQIVCRYVYFCSASEFTSVCSRAWVHLFIAFMKL